MWRLTRPGGPCAVWALVLAGLTVALEGPPAQAVHGEDSGDLVWVTEGSRLRLLDPDTVGAGLLQKVLIPSAEGDVSNGRDSNGQHCELPEGSGGFVPAEYTGQPHPPPGWGSSRRQVGRSGSLRRPTRARVQSPRMCLRSRRDPLHGRGRRSCDEQGSAHDVVRPLRGAPGCSRRVSGHGCGQHELLQARHEAGDCG